MGHQRAIVLFVDLQEGLVNAAQTQSPANVRRGSRALAQFAKALELQAFASSIPAGPDGGPPLLREIRETLPDMVVAMRRTFGAFASVRDGREPTVKDPVLILAGVLTEAAVLRTALEALQSEWQVRVVLDACAGLSERTEAAAIRQIEANGGVATSIASLATEFVDDLSLPSGQEVLSILRGLLNG
ncbi:putative enzyme with cysteine hydrolase domain [Bradyrhizobium sp. ORS 375]|uniref:isochorismatase family protein n=1 Tax=Bradyrhizobium sp. (strain ORS 375) TaxID=566679 RepID=UPI000240967B|nr:isochorismatase family protein [Bradyrhizobium sp. ORS 375]CCD93356.1 putative enzyme with cysteine hydrolase domain [Bradyrhizobium sp. ORS 375]